MKDLTVLEKEARALHVPIMLDGGMKFLLNYIETHPGITRILECGTAVGWSSMNMAMVRPNITIDTVELDENMYRQAVRNIAEAGLSDRIRVHHCDGALYSTQAYYDLFFIDAAKSQYRMYLEHYLPNSAPGSVFIFDNLNFHGIVDDERLSNNRSTVQMTRKILKFRKRLLEDERFDTEFHKDIGDGVAVAVRRGYETGTSCQ